MSLHKIVKLGKIPGEPYGYKRSLAVEVEVEIRETRKGPELSIQGTIWNPNRSDAVSGGQNLEEIAQALPDSALAQRIHKVWKTWHLNSMRAGCEHQRAEEWNKLPIDPSKPLSSYGKHFPTQLHESWNMLIWVRPEEYKGGLLTAPCPTCGYRYGTEWLHEPLPLEIIEEVQSWA